MTTPGLLTGTTTAHIGGLLGLLAIEMSFEYVAPDHVGDSVSCTATTVEKNETKHRLAARPGFVNQDGVEVLRARFSGFPSRIRRAR